jgi:CDP-diacylglycerol---glycerol-3-phosphate 3-phosphatidyltransferase
VQTWTAHTWKEEWTGKWRCSNFRYFELKDRGFAEYVKSKIFGIGAGELGHAGDSPIKIVMFGGHEEKSIVRYLMEEGFGEMHMSTAYLNFPREYTELLQSREISLYASCPKDNAFQSFGCFGSLIARMYRYSFYKTMERIPSAKMHELVSEDHAFHLKGKWAFLISGFWGFKDSWAATVIGSSNFNRRSTERDEETTYLIVTSLEECVLSLRKEVSKLRTHSVPRDISDYAGIRFGFLTILVFLVFNSFL